MSVGWLLGILVAACGAVAALLFRRQPLPKAPEPHPPTDAGRENEAIAHAAKVAQEERAELEVAAAIEDPSERIEELTRLTRRRP